MVVTSVRIDELKPSHSNVCCVCTVIMDKTLAIHHMKVVKGKNGLFVTFPNYGSERNSKGVMRYSDIVHPINDELRCQIVSSVLTAYEDERARLEKKS